MAPASGGTDKTAKEVLDEIGAEVQEKAKRDAEQRGSQLKGDLSKVQFTNGEKTGVRNPCDLHHEFETNATTGNSDPCLNKSAVRFSDTEGAQCYFYKIKNSDSTIGFCAPYRRLHLCVKNLEQIRPDQITSTHNLLSDVLLAAKHEGQSLVEQCEEHKKKNSDFNICTALARSFADLGDIIRGKDLYLGHKLGNNRLEDRLKTIFENIGNKNNAPLDKISIEQVREYWWALNRDQVWKAITCKAKEDNIYSRTAGDTTLWNDNCGHKDEHVPTYLDYVPQYLRWFDEWSEDFCRKRNHKLKLAKDACRNDKEEKYCSLNGYDCTKPIRKEDSCSRENKCTACSNECNPYQLWLEKQQNEFKIQKVKYDKEIERYVDKKDIFNDNINTEYYKNFYQELINTYKNHKDFLKLLNEGMYCKKGVEGESPINFNETGDKDAFDRSKYCQRCPDCIVVCKGERCEENKTDVGNCRSKIIKEILKSEEGTEIDVLYSGKGRGLITEKLKDFCMEPNNYQGTNVEKWNCYNKNNDYNKCEMISWLYQDPKESNLMLSIQCFDSWAQNLLIDTIRWEHQLKDCINNTNVTDCESKCNNNCKCYEAWINRKEDEWKKLKDVLKKKDKNSHNYYNKLSTVFDSFLYPVLDALKKEDKDGKWDQFRKDLEKKFKSPKKNTDTADSEDAIQLLLDHLKDNAITCRDNNSLEGGQKCPQAKNNPCIRNPNNSNKPPKSVKHIAEMMQRRARNQLEENGGEIKLKADASKGEYRQSGDSSDFKDVCIIDKKHSNRNPEYSQEPCHGKGTGTGIETRFEIGTVWEKDKNYMREGHKEFIIPPRRRHICTSNLEYLQTPDFPFNGTDADLINDSFLGDVLLSAKFEASKIIEMYKEKNKLRNPNVLSNPNDQATICQAIRYSFADIGDIIRGRDIWDNETGMKKIREYLPTIFGKIKKKVPVKYDNDKDYKKLREDWWEANRHQVWRAMKCAIDNGNIKKCNGIPIEDYIPERLRWMSEWAEWYVKFQSQASEKCKECWDNGKPGVTECTKDTEICKEYKNKIEKWKEQWGKLKREYSNLYAEAQIAAGKGVRDDYDKVQDKDKPVYDFLYDLHVKNGGTVGQRATTLSRSNENSSTSIDTPYNNAGAYVHDMVNLSDYSEQIDFCDRGKIFKPPSADQPLPPPEGAPPAPEETKDDKVCGMVKDLLQNKRENSDIESCNQKYKDGKTAYPRWTCDKSSKLVNEDGVCMPPRRIKLCVYFLAGNKVIHHIDTKEKLRDAFIKSAAAETFLSWYKYKTDNNAGVELQRELERGKIPEEFKRQMFYTFGDYRDFLFGTDISTGHGKSSNLGKKIDSLFSNGGRKNSDDLSPEQWWDTNGPLIWNGMLCALSYDTKEQTMNKGFHTQLNRTYGYNAIKTQLEDFVKRPQFLRWFTEWIDEFCPEQTKRLATLKGKCPSETCQNGQDTKENCRKACEEYKKWLQYWKDTYRTQSEKFDEDKKADKYKKDPAAKEADNASSARDYLNTQLQKLCATGDCKCMDEKSKKQQSEKKTHNITDMPASLDEEPEDVKDKCTCPVSPLPPPSQPEETDGTSDAVDTSGPKIHEEEERGPAEEAETEPEPDLGPQPEAEPEEEPQKEPPVPVPKKEQKPKLVAPKRTRKIVKRSALPPILGASGFPWTVGIAFAALSYFILKKKTKSSVGNLFQILQIPKSDYDIPTLKSSNRYIPYVSDRHKGKTYIYMEGDSSGDEKYAFMSDTTDVTSSESEYEELDINDIYVPGSPKYKTLIEVVLEPSKRDTPSSDTPTNKFTDEEWNQLKHDFISNMLQNQPNDLPNDYSSGDIPLNTQPNTLYFDKPEEKPFITSIHDRNLYNGEEYSYNINMVNNDNIPLSGKNDVYSGIDLINDSLNSNNVDIYDEVLKRKENELFGTNHPKHTNTHNVTKSSNSDPIDNQLDLFHTWLDRHRDMCEQWNNKEEVLDKLKEEWNKDNNSGDIHTSDSNKTLNTDVSIQIHMDNPKPINEFTNMDTILEDLDKYNEPYYDVQDDIYYDVHDHDASTMDSNSMDVPSKVQIEMDVNTKLVKEKYPIADVWDI
ncbi:erythrocyte membrane protein 1, PfEMP1, putative [Plasmodium sp. gorilla clade G1]|nr:erythrocyte membrane protein 1, PfEMP1, putative [Plasmodium sp. gorilla clade G1]